MKYMLMLETQLTKIISSKVHILWHIGMCLVRITNAILGDENSTYYIRVYNEKNDVFVGMPSVINKDR